MSGRGRSYMYSVKQRERERKRIRYKEMKKIVSTKKMRTIPSITDPPS